MQFKRLVLPLGLSLLLTACSGAPAVSLADKALMPEVVLMQDKQTQIAYRFAAAHPEHLEAIPCYCGCGDMGHRNNLQCYLTPESKPGALVFDNHALACSVCVEITHLTMELVQAGASPAAIRTAVDARFADRGPGTDTPHPGEHTSQGNATHASPGF